MYYKFDGMSVGKRNGDRLDLATTTRASLTVGSMKYSTQGAS